MSRPRELVPLEGAGVLIDTARLVIEEAALLCERAQATQKEARRLRIESQDSRDQRRANQRPKSNWETAFTGGPARPGRARALIPRPRQARGHA
jgi:hypothetical protein